MIHHFFRLNNYLARPGRLAIIGLGITLMLLLTACQGDEPDTVQVEGGDPARGAELIADYDCGSCHYIPGVEGSQGNDAPGLQLWSNRAFVGGAAPNRPENVVAFLMDPQGIQTGSSMPDLGISEDEARHIAAYLFTIGRGESE